MGIKIRAYDEACLVPLASVYREAIRQAGGQYYSEDQIAAWAGFADNLAAFGRWVEDATTFVAMDDNKECIGFGSLKTGGVISALFVAPAAMRRGVGSALLERLLREAQARNVVHLTTRASEFSRPLFEQFGFTVTDIEQTEFNGAEFLRYAMRLDHGER